MERQLGRREEIEIGHQRRYEFAAGRVSGRVLDAACGCGYGSKMIYDVGCEVLGLDIDQKTIEYARRNFPGPDYKVSDICRFEPEDYFDWAVSFETIEHIPDPHTALKNVRGCAERLIISSPNRDFYPFQPDSYKNDEYPHLRHYSPHEFEDLLGSCGWEMLERYGQAKKFKQVDERQGPFQILVCK